jgi:PAS domain S-box-containing protein
MGKATEMNDPRTPEHQNHEPVLQLLHELEARLLMPEGTQQAQTRQLLQELNRSVEVLLASTEETQQPNQQAENDLQPIQQSLGRETNSQPQTNPSPTETLYRSIVEISLEATYRRNLRTDRYDYLSPQIEAILGHTREEMFQADVKTALGWIHPEDFPLVEKEIARVDAECARTSQNARGVLEYRFFDRFGQYRWLIQHFTTQPGSDGRPLYRLGTIHDVTRRKQAEEALSQSQALLQTVIAETPGSIFVKDREGRFLMINPAGLETVQKTAEQVIGKNNIEIFGDSATTRVSIENDRQVMAAGKTQAFEEQAFIDGKLHTFLNSKTPYRDAAGNIIGIIGVARDITERKEREIELNRLNRTLRSISNCNQAMLHAESEAELMDAVCKLVVEDCGHALVWIGFAENDEDKTVRPVAFAGDEQGYLDTLQITWADTERGRGPSGVAIRTGQISVVRNMLSDPAYQPWQTEAIQRGFASVVVFPLKADDQPFGALCIYSKQSDPFSDEEIDLLSELANDTAFGIVALRLKADHARAEAALRENQALLKAVMDGTPNPIFIKDLESHFLLANPACLAGVGKTADQVIGKDNVEFYENHAAARDILEHDRSVLAEGKTQVFEELAIVNGKVSTYLSTKTPYRDGAGNIIGIIGVAQDITERKEREIELNRLNRTLRAISNCNQAMLLAENEVELMEAVCKIVVHDCGHAMVWIGFAENDDAKSVRPVASAGFEDGYLETLELTWADTDRGRGPTGTAIRTGQISACRNMLTDPAFQPWRAEAIKRGYASSLVLPLVTDSQPFGALTIYSKQPDPFSTDEIDLLSELSRDLAFGINALRLKTAHAQAEAALRASQSLLRAVLEGSSSPIFAKDRDSRMLLANPATLAIIGKPLEQVIGKTDAEFYDDPVVGLAIMENDRRIMAAGKSEIVEELVSAGGAQHIYLSNKTPYRDADGNIIGILGVAQDITELKHRESELNQLNRALRALSNSNQAMLHAESEPQLMDAVCKIVVEDCGYAMVWIGFAENDEGQSVRPVAHAGFEDGYLETLELTWADTKRGRSPAGVAIRTGQINMVRNMLTEPGFQPWRAEALKRGYVSGVVLPLMTEGKPFGVICIYSNQPDLFSQDEVNLLSELSHDLAYGIMSLRLKAAHAQAEAALLASEERYRSLFEGMTEGFALHEIICDEQGRPCDYRFLEINSSFERMTGLKREQVVGRLMTEVLPSDDPEWIRIYGEVALTGQPVHFENYSPVLNQTYDVIAYRPAPLQFAVIFMDITQRVQMEADLKEQADKLREQADTLDLAHILVRDMENRILLWNHGAEEMYGFTKEEALGKVSHELFHTMFPDSLEEIEEALATNGSWEGELIHTRRDGSQLIVASHQVVHTNAQNRPVAIIEVNNDVTALKQAEESNAVLARFPEENPAPVMRIAGNGKLQYANAASRMILEAWNCALGEAIPKPWRDLSTSALANHERKIIVFRCGETLYELWFVPIAEAGYVNLYGRDITEQEKTAQELQKTLVELEVRVQKRTHDLTVAYEELYAETDERRRAEESVHKANNYNRSLLEASLDPLVTINPKGKINDVNAATESATGYSRDELIGTDFHQYFTDPDRARAGYQQVFQTGTVRDYELELRHRNGSRIQVLYNASIYRDANGNVSGVFAAARDITQRKRAEEQVHLQTMALESAANGIIITDTRGIIQWANPAFALMTGYTLTEVVGQNIRILNSETHDAEFFKKMWDTIRAGKVWRGEVTNRRKDGSLYIEDQMVTPVIDTRGVITSFIAIQQDISERKEAEQALLKSENRFRSLAENSSDIISRHALDGTFLYISPACRSVLGYSPEELIGHPFYELIHPEDAATATAAYRNIITQPSATMVTYRVRQKGGDYVWLEATCWLIRDEQAGQPVEIQSDMRDITVRKRYEEDLQEERQQLLVLTQAERQQRLFSEGLVQATLALNSSLDANDIFDQILEQIQNVTPFRVATVALVDGNIFRLVRIRSSADFPVIQADLPVDDSLDTFPLLKDMVQSGQILVIPDTAQEKRWIKAFPWEWVRNYIGIPLQTREGVAGFLNIFSDQPNAFDAETIVHLVAFANQASLAIHNANLYKDIANALAHEQAMRAQMVQVEKYTAIGRMVAAITHEINNPLQSIKNCLYLTKQELSSNVNEEHPYLDMASKEVQRLSILVSQLREVYRPRSAGQKQWVNMLDLLTQVKVLLNHQLDTNNVTWVQKPTNQKFLVFGLADQLKQVFLNISLNAIEAMQTRGGQIQIELVADPETKMQGIILRDTGPGISAENLSRLFEPLFSTKQSGMGLGLSISMDIVQSHGGKIMVDSQEGTGTTFTVWLPLVNEEENPEEN